MSEKSRTWLVVGFVLLATHGLSAWYYAARYESRRVSAGPKILTLDATPDEWFQATNGSDSSCYLRCAENVAAGKGVSIPETRSGVTHDAPFYYWGPGAPLVLGGWLKLVGGTTMWTFFWFSVTAQLLFGLMAIATAALWTRNPFALAIVGFCTGFCPPMQERWYGVNLTSSEIVALVPLSMIFFALAKGFMAYRERGGGIGSMASLRRVGISFALGGILIGLYSLSRDSGTAMATFAALFLLGRAVLFDRSRLSSAAVAAALLVAGTAVVRYPVEHWNQKRIGTAVVCTSSAGCIWRYGLWLPHDSCTWFAASGIGFGQYLDPDAAKRVEQHYLENKPLPELYSFAQLVQAVCARPVDAVAYRAARAPILWLGSDYPWPKMEFGLIPAWCLGFYGSLAAFCALQYRQRRQIPEVLYLYLLLLVCASPLIHCEFRYSFPIWNTLVLAPGLLVATLSRNAAGRRSRDRRASDSERPAYLEPREMALAA
jgi:hypothetical protein